MSAENKIFYGWFIIAAAALGICFGFVGTTIYAFSAFTLPLSDEFGWSRGAIALGMTVVYATTIVALPLAGILLDRIGVRKTLLPSTFFFGAILCLFYFLSANIWLYYLGMVSLAALGCGTQSSSYVRLIAAWFDKKKGLALALGVSGAGVGALILPPLVSRIIHQGGWRDAYLALGLINLLVVLPVIFLIVRNKPADVGSYPDGEVPAKADDRARPAMDSMGYEFGECVRSATFWKLAAATALLGVALNGIVSQIIPLLIDRGVARQDAGNLAALLGLSVIVARLGAGYLLDRFHAALVAACLLLCPVAGFLSVAIVPGKPAAIFMLVAVGIGMGLEFDALGFFCVHYFGRVALGKIYSTLFVLFSAGGAAGSYFAGHSYDLFSSYTTMLYFSAAATFVAALCTASLGRSSRVQELKQRVPQAA